METWVSDDDGNIWMMAITRRQVLNKQLIKAQTWRPGAPMTTMMMTTMMKMMMMMMVP